MTRLLRAELLAVRSVRSTVRFVAAAWALALFLAVSFLGVQDLAATPPDDARRAVASASVAGIVLLLLAAASTSGESRHRTLPWALVAAPDRVRLVAAKAVVMGALAAAVGIAGVLLAAVYVVTALELGGGDPPGAGAVALVACRTGAYCALMGVIGTGVGAVARSQTAAVGVLLVVDPLLASLSELAARWGPGGATAALIGEGAGDLVSPWAGGLLLAGYAAASLVAGAVTLRRRDVL